MNEDDRYKAALESLLKKAKSRLVDFDEISSKPEYARHHVLPCGHVAKIVLSIAALQSALAKLEEKKP